MAETIRKTLLAGWIPGQGACGGLASRLDCPETLYARAEGVAVVYLTCQVLYETLMRDPYAA
jgi:hypothetical protein